MGDDIIKTLVLPACGQNGLYVFGALKSLRENEFWHHENIEEIFATSSGTILGMIILLNIDFELIKQYFVCRPWHNLIPSKKEFVYNLFGSGILKKDLLDKLFEPLFKMCEMELDITMLELYKRTQIEFNIYTTNLDDFVAEKMNHISHPNISVLDAIYMSCCIPVLLEPIMYKKKYYIDGAIFHGNPKNEVNETKKENTLSFTFTSSGYYEYTPNSNEQNELTPYLIFKKLISGVVLNFKNIAKSVVIKNDVKLNWIRNETVYDYKSWMNFFYNRDDRLVKIVMGEKYGLLFLTRKQLNKELLNR
tara:strand:+ start:2813 stop:3730 length:918 start_codon:yes stop_codon:yes gene_type:complete